MKLDTIQMTNDDVTLTQDEKDTAAEVATVIQDLIVLAAYIEKLFTAYNGEADAPFTLLLKKDNEEQNEVHYFFGAAKTLRVLVDERLGIEHEVPDPKGFPESSVLAGYSEEQKSEETTRVIGEAITDMNLISGVLLEDIREHWLYFDDNVKYAIVEGLAVANGLLGKIEMLSQENSNNE